MKKIVRKTLIGLGVMALTLLVIVLLTLLPKKVLLILNIALKVIFYLSFAYLVGYIITNYR